MKSPSVMFRNAHVWNGQNFTFEPEFLVDNGVIQAPGKPGESSASLIDLEGGYIIPGITDIHTHADFTASDDRARDFALSQGVTRQVSGLCGFHPVYAPKTSRDDYIRYTGFLGDVAMLQTSWDSFFNRLGQTGPVKKYQLFGLNSYLYNYPLDHDDVLEARIDECVRQYNLYPFYGFSLSLNYHPVKSLPAERLYRFMNGLLARVPACCSYHVRDQRDHILKSIQEVMTWHEGTQARCHISHLKFGGPTHQGQFPERYQVLLNWQARSEFPFSWDTYPFSFASSTLTSLFPTTDFWKEYSEEYVSNWLKENPPPKLAETTIVCDDIRFNQKTLSTIALELGQPMESALLTICKSLNGGGTYQREFCDQSDLQWLVAQQDTFIASDSFGLEQVHPRNTNTFTKVIYEAWKKGESALCEEVVRVQAGVQTVFPEIPTPSLNQGEVAELFFFTPKASTSNQPRFDIRGCIVGKQIFQY